MTITQRFGKILHFQNLIWGQRNKNASNWFIASALTILCAALATAASAQTLDTLVGFNGTDGSSPEAGLVQGSDGTFYGVTQRGGANSQGTVFKMTRQGELTTLHNFCSLGSYCPDGSWPVGGLVQGTDGDFYGTTTLGGGAYNTWGTVFKISGEGLLTTLHSFLFVDGATPTGTLIQASDGNFYGTTLQGGSNTGCFDGPERACGTVFKITPDGQFTTLYNFCFQTGCSDGANPAAGLVQGSDGNLYGTTYAGGTSQFCTGGCGTVFRITLAGAVTTLYSFCAQSGCPDGQWINAGLVQGSDGNFYGTASEGGTGTVYQLGTVFKITPDGQLTTLYSFCSQLGCADGGLPQAALVQGRNGEFYGTTSAGAKRAGTIFKISSNGQLTTLYTFCSLGVYPYCSDGNSSVAPLVQGSDWKFYGTTRGQAFSSCAHDDCGTIFRWFPNVALAPAFAPGSLSFGHQAVDTTSSVRSVYVKNLNTGNATLDFGKFTITSPFAISFNTCDPTLGPGHSCRVDITFSPTALGTASGTLTAIDNSPKTTQIISLLGTGVEQATVTPSSQPFGNVKVGMSSGVKNVTLKNNLPTTLTSISYSVFGPFAVSASTCGPTLVSKESCTIGVTFSPVTVGLASGTLIVSDTANNTPQVINLTGTGD